MGCGLFFTPDSENFLQEYYPLLYGMNIDHCILPTSECLGSLHVSELFESFSDKIVLLCLIPFLGIDRIYTVP